MITLLNNSITSGKNLADAAAIINQLDTIITCDSLIAHIAGALGKNTILLLPELCQWRWGVKENRTPFYACMHVVRYKQNDYSNLLPEIMNYVGKYSR